ELGQASRQWAREGAPPTIGREAVSRWGRGGPQWAAFEAVADELWRLQGVRYREFAGKRNDEGLMHWSRRARTELRRLPRARSTAVELWTFGRIPPSVRLTDRRCVDWIVPCMPHRRGASGTALLPAALAYQV